MKHGEVYHTHICQHTRMAAAVAAAFGERLQGFVWVERVGRRGSQVVFTQLLPFGGRLPDNRPLAPGEHREDEYTYERHAIDGAIQSPEIDEALDRSMRFT